MALSGVTGPGMTARDSARNVRLLTRARGVVSAQAIFDLPSPNALPRLLPTLLLGPTSIADFRAPAGLPRWRIYAADKPCGSAGYVERYTSGGISELWNRKDLHAMRVIEY